MLTRYTTSRLSNRKIYIMYKCIQSNFINSITSKIPNFQHSQRPILPLVARHTLYVPNRIIIHRINKVVQPTLINIEWNGFPRLPHPPIFRRHRVTCNCVNSIEQHPAPFERSYVLASTNSPNISLKMIIFKVAGKKRERKWYTFVPQFCWCYITRIFGVDGFTKLNIQYLFSCRSWNVLDCSNRFDFYLFSAYCEKKTS